MKIRGWHIEAFGIHRDWRVDDLSHGFNVFYGPNEAGKSTLLAFLRGVLFGYPDGRSSEPRYLPKGGGAHGGQIMLHASDAESGDVVVERYAGRGQKVSVTLEDGRPGDVADLAARLGHADARLFRTVFAFGLPELQKLGSLGEAGIQDHILAAGVTGGGRSAREAIQELRESARNLFDGPKGRKKNDRARVLVGKIAELNADLFLRQEAAERYPDLRDREESLAGRLRSLEAEAETARAVGQRARKLIELWTEVWSPLAEAREQAAKLAPSLPEGLPADARDRLAHCLQQLQQDEQGLEVVRSERSAVAAQLEELRLDDPARAVTARVDGLQDRLALHLSQSARRQELEVQRDACDQRVGAVLARLLPEIPKQDGEVRLRAVQATALRREELRDWKSRVDEVAGSLRDAGAASKLLGEQLGAARQRVVQLEDRVAGAPAADAEGVQRRLDAARSLRQQFPRLRELEADLGLCTAALAKHESVPAGLAGGGLAGGLASLPAVLGVLGFVVAGAGSLAALQSDRTDWLLMAGGLAVASVCSLLLAVVRARKRRHGSDRASQAAQDAALDASRRVEAALAEARPHLGLLGLDRVSETELADREAALDAERSRVEAIRRLDDELGEARGQLERLVAQEAAVTERVRDAQPSLAAIDAEFSDWKCEVGVPDGLGVESAGEFLEEARRGRDALDERDRLVAERQRIQTELESFRAEVDAVLADAAPPQAPRDGQPPAGDEDRVAALSALRDRCAADRAAREGREPLERRGVDLRVRFAAGEAQLLASRAALSALLREAGVPDVGALQLAIATAAQAAELDARVATSEQELSRRLDAAGEEEAEALGQELPGGALDTWRERAASAEARSVHILAERDEVLREHQDRARDRERLEASTHVMDLELQKSALEQELHDVLDDWRRLRLSAQLIEEALRRFEEAHQPGVLREASTLFARVTGGRYPRIVQADGRESFVVVAADGTHRSPSELSQGTMEQLYLCIRLGLVAELARSGRSLPVVMDDVLVNFDDERAIAMAGVLAAFAEEHQLLFFTCSSRTRDLLSTTAPEAEIRQIGA